MNDFKNFNIKNDDGSIDNYDVVFKYKSKVSNDEVIVYSKGEFDENKKLIIFVKKLKDSKLEDITEKKELFEVYDNLMEYEEVFNSIYGDESNIEKGDE